ncbi:hypothetical protein GCM10027605_12810 [Micromonospora zhanjiangensis]
MTRFATVFLLFAGLVAVGSSPALAADEAKVGLRVPDSFTAGSSGQVVVTASRKGKECVVARTALAIELRGLEADQIRVEAMVGRDWQPVGLSGVGVGTVATSPTQPERPMLCEKRNVAVRYRVTFLSGVTSGTATVVAQVSAADGNVLGRKTDTARVAGRKASSSTPSATPSAAPSPSAVSDEQGIAASSAPAVAAPVQKSNSGGGFGLGGMVMVVGLGMVGIGAALLVVLLRRNRRDREPAADDGYQPVPPVVPAQYPPRFPGTGPFPPRPAAADATVVMPRLPNQP